MSLLPYTKTYAVDMTRGITAATPPASLNIASLIVAETGPVDRVTLRNQSDLVDVFCTGTAISATDNETIQFNGALLTQVATDVFRVDTSAMRAGVGSLGSKLYFDKEFNLLEKVTRAQLLEKPSALASLYVVLTPVDNAISPIDGNTMSGNQIYYIGVAPNGISGNTTDLTIEGMDISIANFIDVLHKNGIILTYTENAGNYVSTLNPAYKAVVIESGDRSGDLYNVTTDDFSNILNVVAATDAQIENNNYFMTIDSRKGFIPEGSQATTNADQTIEIKTNDVTTNYSPRQFMVKVLNSIYSSNDLIDPWTQDIKISLKINKALSEDTKALLSKYALIEEETETTTTGGEQIAGQDTPDDPSDDEYTPTVTETTTVTTITAYNATTFMEDGIVLTDVDNQQLYVIDGSDKTVQFVLVDMYETHTDIMSDLVITNAQGGNPYFAYSSLSTTSVVVDDTALTYSTPEMTVVRMNSATDATNSTYKVEDELYIIVDNYCFYAGDKPDQPEDYDADTNGIMSYVTVSKAKMSVPDFIKAVKAKIAEIYTIGTGFGGYLLVSGKHDFVTSENIEMKNEMVIDQSKVEDSFAIVCRFTSSVPLFDFEYSKNKEITNYEAYDLTYRFKTKENKITISFEGDAIDGYGKSLFYDNYNEGDGANPYIYIKKLDGDGVLSSYSPDVFGNEVLNNDPTEADYANAILKYLDVKEKQYDFVTDAGHISVALASACKRVADERFTMYYPSFPAKKDVASLKEYASSINLNDFRGYYLVPSHKSTYNGQFLTTVPASLTMMFARINAFSTTVAEFSPLFGTIKGTATAPYMIKNFTNAEAQALADMNINVITKDVAGTYIRSNFTSQTENSYLSEEQNAYMTNVLCHICEEYNPTIIAELNTSDLRASVEENLTKRIQARMITGKNPTLAAFKVVCNDELNPLSVIEARQLVYQVWVQYTPSVAYVLAYVYVKRLGSF